MTRQHAVPSPSRAWYVALVAGMASYVDAAAIVSFGTAMVVYQRAAGLTPATLGIASGILTLGIALGAFAGGRLGDRFGRRPVFSATMVLIIAGAGLLAVSTADTVIFAGALLLGLGTGADLPVSLSMIAEVADESRRGRLISLTQVFWFAGILAALGLGIALGNAGRPGGQAMFLHLVVVALLLLLGRLSIPESSAWLAARATAPATWAGSRMTELLQPPLRARFVALVTFYTLTNLSANTMGQFGTYLLVNVAGLDVRGASAISLALLPLGVLGTLWFMAVADSRRRFAYFTVGAVLVLLGNLAPVLVGFSVPSYVGSRVLVMLGAGFAGEAIMKLWTQESFPTLLRASAQGSVIAVARVAAAALAAVTPQIIGAGAEALYALLSAFCAVGLGAAWVVFRRPAPLPDSGRTAAEGVAG